MLQLENCTPVLPRQAAVHMQVPGTVLRYSFLLMCTQWGQQGMAPAPASLLHARKTHTELPAPGFRLAQPWLLQTLGKWTTTQDISVDLFLPYK